MQANLAVLEGDGVGPEIMAEGLQVLQAVAEKFGHQFDCHHTPFGANAYFSHGSCFPAESKRVCDDADAILKGPVGLPLSKMDTIPVDQRPEPAVLELRQRYTTFANYRPVVLPESLAAFSPLRPELLKGGVDILMIRELVGGIYFGKKVEGDHTQQQRASDECAYTAEEITRVTEVAFLEARKRGAPLTVAHKANVLATGRFWQHVVAQVAERFADVELRFILADNAAYQLTISPTQFNGVFLLENMQGDILSDQGGGIVGSLGLMCSASVGPTKAYYEPVHGSAPDIAGTGTANPFSMIGSMALMLEKSLHLQDEADAVWQALWGTLEAGQLTADLATSGALSTKEFGAAVAERLR
jgi:3-isopropylmalate dehydrogenase